MVSRYPLNRIVFDIIEVFRIILFVPYNVVVEGTLPDLKA